MDLVVVHLLVHQTHYNLHLYIQTMNCHPILIKIFHDQFVLRQAKTKPCNELAKLLTALFGDDFVIDPDTTDIGCTI